MAKENRYGVLARENTLLPESPEKEKPVTWQKDSKARREEGGEYQRILRIKGITALKTQSTKCQCAGWHKFKYAVGRFWHASLSRPCPVNVHQRCYSRHQLHHSVSLVGVVKHPSSFPCSPSSVSGSDLRLKPLRLTPSSTRNEWLFLCTWTPPPHHESSLKPIRGEIPKRKWNIGHVVRSCGADVSGHLILLSPRGQV